MEKRNTKTEFCAAIGRSRGPEKKHISVVRPAQINWPCVQGNVSKDITPSRTSKSFSVGPIVYWGFVFCVHRRVCDSYKKKGVYVYFVAFRFMPLLHQFF
jgi:hypothetical protein